MARRFGVREATLWRTINKVEKARGEHKRFHLPGKKSLHDDSLDLTVIVGDARVDARVDARQQRVERPPKNSVASPGARSNVTPRKDRS